MGFYQVVRYIGFSLGSALAASILAGHTPAGQHLPTESGYTLVIWIAVVICVAAAAPRLDAARARAASPPTAREELLGEEDAELATAGLVGLTRD